MGATNGTHGRNLTNAVRKGSRQARAGKRRDRQDTLRRFRQELVNSPANRAMLAAVRLLERADAQLVRAYRAQHTEATRAVRSEIRELVREMRHRGEIINGFTIPPDGP